MIRFLELTIFTLVLHFIYINKVLVSSSARNAMFIHMISPQETLTHSSLVLLHPATMATKAELSMGWVNPRVGLGRVASGFSIFTALCWVGC